MARWTRILTLLGALFMMSHVTAHEMGIALLEITETSPGQGFLKFKRSKSADGRLAAIDFVLQPQCNITREGLNNAHPAEVTLTATFNCPDQEAVNSIHAQGFTRLAPDLAISITRQGMIEHAVLTPAQPTHHVGLPTQSNLLFHYFEIGSLHMLLGLDHLLFVVGLFLLWATRQARTQQLVVLATCFTLGHSLTLALLSLNALNLPLRAIEAWIALSVLYMATKIVFAQRGQEFNWTDYLLIIGFGLLHGAGFSGAISAQGFSESHLLPTLFAFNLGIEAAQIVALLSMILIRQVLSTSKFPNILSTTHQVMVMLIGGVALVWTTQRVLQYV